jgi:hypothetical protein
MEGLTDASDKGEITTSSGNESDTDQHTYVKNQSQMKTQPSHLYPKLIDTIAVNYMGVIMLRRPIGQAMILR